MLPAAVTIQPIRLMPPNSSYGFHEYRVLGTYREPRLFPAGEGSSS